MAKTPYQRFADLPASFKSTAVTGVILVVGALTPWAKLKGAGVHHWVPGIDFNAGALLILIGVGVIALLARLSRTRRIDDSAALAFIGLGVLAVGIVVVTGLRIREVDQYSIAWGLYISGLASVGLFIDGLRLVGRRPDSYPPPD